MGVCTAREFVTMRTNASSVCQGKPTGSSSFRTQVNHSRHASCWAVRDSDRSASLRGWEKQGFVVAGTVQDVDDLDAVVLQAVEDQVIANGTAANAF